MDYVDSAQTIFPKCLRIEVGQAGRGQILASACDLANCKELMSFLQAAHPSLMVYMVQYWLPIWNSIWVCGGRNWDSINWLTHKPALAYALQMLQDW